MGTLYLVTKEVSCELLFPQSLDSLLGSDGTSIKRAVDIGYNNEPRGPGNDSASPQSRAWGRRYVTEKSLHKLLYRIDVKSAEQDLDIEIPYYWYLFGTVSPATPSTVPSASINEPGLKIACVLLSQRLSLNITNMG